MTDNLRTVVASGRTIRYFDSGPPDASRVLLLIHAFPVGPGMWAPQLNAFPGWRVVAPALPGFDGSDAIPDSSMDAYAREVLSLLDSLGIASVVVCGLSMGGYVTFALVEQARTRVAGLILADTRSGPDTEQARAGRRRILELVDGQGPAAVAIDMLPKLLADSTRTARPEVEATVRALIERQPSYAIADATRAMMARPDSTPLLASISVPTLLIVGEDDALTPPEEAERMGTAIPSATLVRIPGAGHLSNVENSESFNAAVRSFLTFS